MNINRIFAPLLLCAVCAPVLAASDSTSWDGLVQVKARHMDMAWLLPGADFRAYTKVMIDPAQVAFRKNWLKDVNNARPGLSSDVTEQEAEKIAAAARTNFNDVLAETFRNAGYEVVTEPAPGVLRLSPFVVDLYVNAPDTMSASSSRSYSMQAGEAKLVLEARDAMTGTLLGRALDRRETQRNVGLTLTSSVSNTADFRQLFRRWADICVKGLAELKEQSPVPQDLKPNQKL